MVICVLSIIDIRRTFLGSRYIKLWFALWNKMIFADMLAGKEILTLIKLIYGNVWYFIPMRSFKIYLFELGVIDLSFVFRNFASQSDAGLAHIIVSHM